MKFIIFSLILSFSSLLNAFSIPKSTQCAIEKAECVRKYQKTIKKHKQHEYLTPACERSWSCTEEFSCTMAYCICNYAGAGNQEPGALASGGAQCGVTTPYNCGKDHIACGESL